MAELMLVDIVPQMIIGSVTEVPLDLSKGSYFSGRRPEDGYIDWSLPAREIHNLVRAVAPPFPGAFFKSGSHRIEIMGSYYRGEAARFNDTCIYFEDGGFQADCSDGQRFKIMKLVIDQSIAGLDLFESTFGSRLILSTEHDS
jgi:methionyl-tRNA formyltransferase